MEGVSAAGFLFIAVDTAISNGPIRQWMQRHFRSWAAPGVKLAEVDKAVPHISTRIVSSLHILIQACSVNLIKLPRPNGFLSKLHCQSQMPLMDGDRKA